ncbi:MAG: radical SAM protein [Phyllobacteriaceae bacterium]|nr:radical SAM protein [Phyllobacteriaceae bacterium]
MATTGGGTQTAAARRSDVPPIRTLQVVLKVAERCNINCSYCYYFNMGETSALERPALIDLETVRALAWWIRDGCAELGIGRVSISFHGGEPLLLKPARFSAACTLLRETIEPVAEVSFAVQTNGTIISPTWLDLFADHRVHVGVSIDGDRTANDRFRLAKDGGSTFAQVEQTIRRLVEWSGGDQALGPSTISVLDHRNDYEAIYHYLRSLGIMNMSFLLPDRSHDHGFAADEGDAEAYGRCMSDLFTAWFIEDDPNVNVRQIKEVVSHFRNTAPAKPPVSAEPAIAYQIIVAQSDGTVSVNDSLIPALDWFKGTPRVAIADLSMPDFLADRVFGDIRRAGDTIATACRSCDWRGLCRSGDLENRYAAANGFDNPSVYCDGYKTFYETVCGTLLANNYPVDLFEQRLSRTLETVGH